MEFWNQGWVGIVAGGVIGIVVSYVFYVLAKRPPLLCEAVRASRVIGLAGTADFSEHVAVTFRDEKIPQLSVATVTVWNAGSTTLTHEALVTRDHLRVVLGGPGRILDAKVDAEPQPACGCNAALDPNEPGSLRLSFEYLNPGDGFSVRLLHTASEPIVKIAGALKGAQRRSEDGESGSIGRVQRTLRSLVPWVVGIACIYFVNSPWFKSLSSALEWLPAFQLIAVCSLFALVVAVGNWSGRKPHQMPRALRQAEHSSSSEVESSA